MRHTPKKCKCLTSCCGNDTSGRCQICGFREKHIRSRVLYFAGSSSRKQPAAANVQRYGEERDVWSRERGLSKGNRNCIATLSCRYSLWVCSSHVGTWRKQEIDRYKHSRVLAQSLGQVVMTEAEKMREDFQRAPQGVAFFLNTTKWGTSCRQRDDKKIEGYSRVWGVATRKGEKKEDGVSGFERPGSDNGK